MPRNLDEQSGSKFRNDFGKKIKLSLGGLHIEGIEYYEPSNTLERRRHPRSGIGNKISVLLSHEGLICVMKELGFLYHEFIDVVPSTPRMRTAFFRQEPRGLISVTSFSNPLPPIMIPIRHFVSQQK